MNHMRGLSIVVSVLCVALATTGVLAAVPIVMSHQGRLLDASDHPLTGTYTLTYSIYEVPTGGAPLWTEDHAGVSVIDGLFSVELGATVPLSADVLSGSGGGGGGATVVRYLQIQVSGQSPISPRTQLLASPYAVASSRVSGDIETGPGSMAINDGIHDRAIVRSLGSVTYVGTWDVTNNNSSRLYTDTDSAGLSVRIEDRDLIGLRVNKGINEPLPYSTLHISDPSGKSSSSLVCTNVSSNLDCDVDANGSGHAERNMRVRINELESRLTIASDIDDDGLSDLEIKGETGHDDAMLTITSQDASQKKGEANIAALLNGNVVVGCATHTDASGVADNSCTMTTNDSSSTSTISGSRGKYYVLGSTHKYNGGSSSLGVAADVDVDGHAERSIWEKVDNTGSIAAVEVDINDDGVPDSYCRSEAEQTRTELKTHFQTGDFPTQTQVTHIADASGASSAVEVDLDGDGVADNSMQSTCDASSVKIILDRDSGRSRALMAAEDSGSRIVMDYQGIQAFVASSSADSTKLELSSPSGGANLKGQLSDIKSNLELTNSGGSKLQAQVNEQKCNLSLVNNSGDESVDVIVDNGTGPGAHPSSSFRLGRPAINEALVVSDESGVSLKTNAGGRNIGLHVSGVTGQCKLAMVDATMGVDDTTIVIDGNLKRFGIGVSQP
ncbi:MAG: hypothetical protein NT028_08700, partial [candidate division Zixibacteria bacterium]|nr:hypothetical protein [candidate division Zixibacteria bacterium]